MSRRDQTPERLAREIASEVDDVLLTLWDIGLDYLTGPATQVRSADVIRAREALGLAGGRELSRVDYWLSTQRWDRGELVRRLETLNVRLSPSARTLPKGAIAKLRRDLTAPIPVVASPTPPPTTKPLVEFEWRQIGHIRDIKFLTESEIVDIHFALADDFADSPDPVSPAGVRDEHLLASAATRPSTALGPISKYQTVELASAALMHSLVHNHAFYNGNKRSALVSMLSMLDRNGVIVTCDQDEIFRWTIRVAQHRTRLPGVKGDASDIEVASMATWLTEHSRLLERGEKVLTWKFLRRRLAAFGVSIEATGSRGGRLNLYRVTHVRQRGVFGRELTKTRTLSVQMVYAGDGRDVSKSDLKHLRRELHLDDDHGIDSAMFYGIDSTPPDQFIAEYRKTLVRLAKL
jgi:death-on-curing family protein